MLNQKQCQDAYKKAIELLARREHSSIELQRKLILRGFLEATVKQVVKALADKNLQSDTRFAESYVRYRQQAGFGPCRIKQELQERGISAELIQTYLNPDDEYWHALMINAWRKKFSRAETVSKEKQLRFLMRRGFLSNDILKWLNASRSTVAPTQVSAK